MSEASREAEERRRNARFILWAIVVTYGVLFLLAVLLATWGNEAQQRWALAGLTTVLASQLGFIAGRKS